jgi:hypothetical protein
MEETNQPSLSDDMQMLIAGIIPNTRYFDSRFEQMQTQIDGLKVEIEGVKSTLQLQTDSVKSTLQAETGGVKSTLRVQIDDLKKGQNETNNRIDNFGTKCRQKIRADYSLHRSARRQN